MRIVILGAGQVGASVAEGLVSEENDITVIDCDGPRLMALQAKLAGSAPDALDALARKMPDPADWRLAPLCTPDADDRYSALAALLSQCLGAAWQLSEDISLRYFTHTFETGQSLGA